MMILVAPDKFKHALSSLEVCAAIKEGFLRASEKFEVKIMPLADGGDGLTEIIEHYLAAKKRIIGVTDPLFRPINSSFLLSGDGNTAYIEMAKASGLTLLKPEEYNCRYTTTFGTGDLIRAALNLNVKNIVIGIGGSATNDCGIGMAAALGYRFLDKAGNELKPVADSLLHIEHIDASRQLDLRQTKFTVACDVKNPLTGNQGATKVYAKQKGASAKDIEYLEAGMMKFANLLESVFSKEISNIEGAGAAGGLGAGCLAFLNAELRSGIEIVFDLSNAREHIKSADLVITGEGKIDHQSLSGKVIAGVGQLCRVYKKKAVAFCGINELSNSELQEINIQAAIQINTSGALLGDEYKNAYQKLASKAFEFARSL